MRAQLVQPAERVLVIGLDGATWTYLAPLAERGVLPTLRRLMETGAWGALISTNPPLTPPAWASLVTGTNPGKHGIYHFRLSTAGSYYQQRLSTSRDVQRPAIWQRLNQHGKRVGVMNVPNCHPLYAVDGFMTTDSFTPHRLGFAVHPPDLREVFRDYIVDVKGYPKALPGSKRYLPQMRAFIEENRRVLLSQADVAAKLMASQPWQFLMIAWMVTDRLGHFCWKHIQPNAPTDLASEADRQIAKAGHQLLAEVDRQIDRLIAAAGPKTTVLLVSDHGFGPHPTRFFHAARWLRDRGYLKLLPIWHPRRLAHGYLPRALKGRLGGPIDSKYGLVDWPRTRAWADTLGARTSGIRVNREGQYPHGMVKANEAGRLLDQIGDELQRLRTAQGEPVIAKIQPGAELYRGPYAEAGPDLVVTLADDFNVPPSFRRDVRAANWLVPNRHILRDGEHLPAGLFLAQGANIAAAGKLPAQSIYAVAPTILQALGLPIDDDIDAEPIDAAFTDEYLREHPPRRSSEPAATRRATPQSDYSEDDEAEVEERLRNLGYLD